MGIVGLLGAFRFALSPIDKVSSVIDSLATMESMKAGQISFTLLDENGKMLVQKNSATALMPASTLKVVTTGVALEMLSDTFRFSTCLAYSGTIKNDVLKGNICIKGSGDPSLGASRFKGYPDFKELIELWVEAIKKEGIKSITGNIVADPSVFGMNTLPPGWVWTDIGNYYGAGASGLNLNENSYRLYFKPGVREGEKATFIRTEPDLPYLSFINEMKTGSQGSGDNGYIFGGIFSNTKYLSGTIPAGRTEFFIQGAIPDPAFFCAYALQTALERGGVNVLGASINGQKEAVSTDGTCISICCNQSPPLSDLIKKTNYYSINLYAEALLKRLGYEETGKGTTENGIEVVKNWLQQKGIEGNSFFMKDGSGLSPANAISSKNLATILFKLKGNATFVHSLPVAGQSGTLYNVCKNAPASGKICAKSGSFARVLCYSGYVNTIEGKLLPFSILVNNFAGSSSPIKKKIEEIMNAMVAI